MEIKYVCPYWGWHLTPNPFPQVERGTKNAAVFIDQVVVAGYDGIEIDIPLSREFENELLFSIENQRKHRDFVFIAQQWLPPAKEGFEDYQNRFKERLEQLTTLHPDFINSHTGKDYFSFEQNCQLIDIAFDLSAKTGIRILHETHRGRFSFHLPRTLTYLKKF